jgi:hypothetical protein
VRLDFTLSLFWLSLAISAAAVMLFVWLMREERNGRKDTRHPAPLPEEEGETEDGSSRH